jgi:hypothetical protein
MCSTVHHKENRNGPINMHRPISHPEELGMSPYHSYVVSEDGEFVKVSSEGYEYTGMFVLD